MMEVYFFPEFFEVIFFYFIINLVVGIIFDIIDIYFFIIVIDLI